MHTLTLKRHETDPFVVVEASGELDLHTLDEFERVVGDLLESSSVVVDLSGVDFFAICALRSLIVCRNRAQAAGREVCYAAPSSQLVRLLTISGLLRVLPVRLSDDVAPDDVAPDDVAPVHLAPDDVAPVQLEPSANVG